MIAFMVELDDKPGELARITELIAQKGINIEAFTGGTAGGKGTIVLVTNDEAGTRKALQAANCTVRELELVTASIAHTPGTLAALARRLADAGINIHAAMPVGMDGGNVNVAFATSDPARTRELIGKGVRASIPA